MKQLSLLLLAVFILLAIATVGGAFYVVNEAQQVIITQFGKPVGEPVITPGLKIKTPFIQTANSCLVMPMPLSRTVRVRCCGSMLTRMPRASSEGLRPWRAASLARRALASEALRNRTRIGAFSSVPRVVPRSSMTP